MSVADYDKDDELIQLEKDKARSEIAANESTVLTNRSHRIHEAVKLLVWLSFVVFSMATGQGFFSDLSNYLNNQDKESQQQLECKHDSKDRN